MPIKKLEEMSEDASEVIRTLGLSKSTVFLSEGYCPGCRVRSTATSLAGIWDDEDNTLVPQAVVHCEQCHTRWRSGINPENDMPWIEHTRALGRMTLTLTVNPPSEEPRCVDDRWWDDDDG